MLVSRGRRTVNRILQDRAIRHAVYLQRLKTGEANRILSFVARDLYSEVRRLIRDRVLRIERLGTDTGPATTQRLREIEEALRAIVSARLADAVPGVERAIGDIGVYEANWQTATIREALPIDITVNVPNPAMLRSIVTSRPMQGRLLRDWWAGLEPGLRDGVMRTLRVGVALGRTNPEIVSQIIDVGGGAIATSARAVDSVVRTAIAHVSNDARQRSYEENADIMSGWQFVATLDDRTTILCASLDGQVFPLGQGPYPPRHWNCRSTTAPVLKSWKDLGIDLDEAPAGTRASMNGEVPESITYPEWLIGQPQEVQNEVLGPARAQLFRTGQVEMSRFVDDRGRRYTLDELATREGLSLADILGDVRRN